MPQIHQLQLQQQDQQQHSLLLERRIIELLTGTNLTFKEIITKLDSENLSASIGIIRRINRDNRYRRPRYDSKLTPAQRESLVEELRDHNGLKPNLSLLAKRYGVCHGSVWYWWDKLNRIKRGASSGKLTKSREMFRVSYGKSRARNKQMSGRRVLGPSEVDPIDLGAAETVGGMLEIEEGEDEEENSDHQGRLAAFGRARNCRYRSAGGYLLDTDKYNYVGRVSIVPRNRGEPIDLPILMFSRRELIEMDSAKTSPSSLTSGEGSLELSSSPSPLVVVDDEDEEEEEEELRNEFGGSTLSSSSSASSSPLLGGSMCDDQEPMQLDLTTGVSGCKMASIGVGSEPGVA